MRKRLSYIAPLKCGVVVAIWQGILALIAAPFFVLISILTARGDTASGNALVGSLIMLIVLPIAYIILGFIGGIVPATVYNLVASWTGGLEFAFLEVIPASALVPGPPPKFDY